MKKIELSGRCIEYSDLELPKNKKINKDIAGENLNALSSIFEAAGVHYGLMYGTLLGAVREGDFISHDEDTDVFVLLEERSQVLECLPSLLEGGFQIARYDGELLSVIRGGEYIDLYFFKKGLMRWRSCQGYKVKTYHLESTVPLEFRGRSYPVPVDFTNLLVDLYGKSWQVPRVGVPASNYNFYITVMIFLSNKFPTSYRYFRGLVRKMKGEF